MYFDAMCDEEHLIKHKKKGLVQNSRIGTKAKKSETKWSQSNWNGVNKLM